MILLRNGEPMEKILLVEDSKLVSEVIKERIQSRWPFEILSCHTLAETKRIAYLHHESIFLALLDLRLPDAPNGEVVDMVRELDIPVIVFTGTMDRQIRELMFKKRVIDYVVKRNLAELDYVMRLVHRIYHNRQITVLVVDDSSSSRMIIRNLMENYCLKIVEAEDGQEALKVLAKVGDIKMVVVDYNLPDIKGDKLISRIRNKFSMEDLAILGVSGTGKGELSALMLKAGANDFITKPFYNEEFFCRVMQNLDALERIASIREASFTDFLTGMRNRKYFFETASNLWQSAKRRHIHICLAMLDIDQFKRLNDTHGHHIGDLALKHVAEILKKMTRQSDCIARIGGEEFALLLVNPEDQSERVLENLRVTIAESPLIRDLQPIALSISIGAAVHLGESLEEMLRRADQHLYLAKEQGRNRTVLEPS